MADAPDLKSGGSKELYRFDPGFRHQFGYRTEPQAATRTRCVAATRICEKDNRERRRVEQLVARRAHNPEVKGSSPFPATK